MTGKCRIPIAILADKTPEENAIRTFKIINDFIVRYPNMLMEGKLIQFDPVILDNETGKATILHLNENT